MSVTTIASPELRRLRSEDPSLRLVDVRTGGEFESSHIPGSFNIPLDNLGDHAAELAAVEHPVVLICQSGNRAKSAHTTLDQAGKAGLFVLDGGMNAWQDDGGEVNEGATARWAMDRQVRLVAGSLVLGGLITSIAAPNAKWLSAGVGGGLVFSAVSNTCAMANVLGRLPYNQSDSGGDIDTVVARLNETPVRS